MTGEMLRALRHLGCLVIQNGMSKQSVAAAVAREMFHVKAHALGLDDTQAQDILAEVEQDCARWPWHFDIHAEADRRLMLQRAELRQRPPQAWRDAAEHLLASGGVPFTPADVDRLAVWLDEAP